jgi:DNA-directed RNA polymerase subunit E'/Rpb7
MSRITIIRKICLEPRYLDENLQEHLKQKIHNDVLNQCDQTYGYITKIYDNIEIVENIISQAGPGIFFKVKFTAKALRPEVDSVYEGKICMVFAQGIFVEIMGKMKVLIPADKMGNFKYNKTTSSFKNGTKTLTQGDKVDVVITLIKYEKHNFNCIGNLKTSEK